MDICAGLAVSPCIEAWLDAAKADVLGMLTILLGIGFTIFVALWALRFGWRVIDSMLYISWESKERWNDREDSRW